MASTSAGSDSFHLMVGNLNKAFAENKVDVKLLLPIFDYQSSRSTVLIPHFKDLYTLPNRVTEIKLLEECSKEIKIAQENYIESIEKTKEKLLMNIQKTQEMDLNLGTGILETSADETYKIEIAKDGSHRLRCPIIGCATSTFKLYKHLHNVHSQLTQEQKNYAMSVAKKIERNRTNLSKKLPDSAPAIAIQHKKKGYQNTELVSRKHNYKKCLICSSLVMNMSEHISLKHKIKKENILYDTYVRDAEVVPKVFTKKRNKVTVELSDDEMAEAKELYQEDVFKQNDILVSLKQHRAEINKLMELAETATENEAGEINLKLIAAQSKYKELRYKDRREYSEKCKIWKEGFETYLQNNGTVNPRRRAQMAMDVLIPFETETNSTLTFKNLLDSTIMNKILYTFKGQPNTSYSSKLKHLGIFCRFINYLVLDVKSPEFCNNASIANNLSLKLKSIEFELSNMRTIFSKELGANRIATRERAKKKLVSERDIKEIIISADKYLIKVDEDDRANKLSLYSERKILEVRDHLIAVGAIRLGRRSKEMIRMTLTEMNQAEERIIDGEQFKIVSVFEQKNTRTGHPAPVMFSLAEFKTLETYVSKLRPKLNCVGTDVVFPSKLRVGTAADRHLSFGAIHRILTKFKSNSGRFVSSRSLRGSIITNHRKNNPSEEEKRLLAKTMSHTYETSMNNYEYNSLNDSVVKSASNINRYRNLQNNDDTDDTLYSTFTDSEAAITLDEASINNEDSDHKTISQSLVTDSSTQITSTPLKSPNKRCPDATLINLRSKKVKKNEPSVTDKIELEEYLRKSIKNKIDIEKPKTAGRIQIKKYTEAVPGNLIKMLSVKEIREIIFKIMNE